MKIMKAWIEMKVMNNYERNYMKMKGMKTQIEMKENERNVNMDRNKRNERNYEII